MLGMPARTMGMLAEAGQQSASNKSQAADYYGGGIVGGIVGGAGAGFMAMAGFVMGLGDMAEMALGGHRWVRVLGRRIQEE